MKMCPCCKEQTNNFGVNRKYCRPCNLLKPKTRWVRFGYGKMPLKSVKDWRPEAVVLNGRRCKRCQSVLVGKQEFWCSRYCAKYGLKKEYNKRVMEKDYQKYIARRKISNMLHGRKIVRPRYCSFY